MTLVDSSTSPLLAARTALAAAVESATGYTCHASFTTAVVSPCIIIEPDGWQPLLSSGGTVYRVKVSCLYASKDTTDMANGVEELARVTYNAARDQGWRTPDVPAPGSVKFGAGETLREFAGVQFILTEPIEME